jgi:hypothetical protein
MSMQHIRGFLAVGTLALVACATTAGGTGRMIGDGQSFSMRPAGSVTFADHSQLRYVRLVADSRCRPDVQCIRAGDAEIALQWTPASGATQDFSLKTPPPAQPQSRDLGARRLTLLSLDRGEAPQAEFRIESID